MERNFDNRDFEQFLKQNADQYRMYPSEKVWTGINNTLHPRRRWYGIAALLLLLTGAVVSGVMILQPGSDIQSTSKVKRNIQALPVENKIVLVPAVSATVLTALKTNKSIAINRIPTIVNNYSAIESSQIAIKAGEIIPSTVSVPEKFEKNSLPLIVNNNFVSKAKAPVTVSPVIITNSVEADNNFLVVNSITDKNNPATDVIKPSVMASDLIIKSPETSSIQKNKKTKKAIWQLYFTPGISYRRLSENKAAILAASGTSSVPSNLALRDVKGLVTHRPDIGFELGLAAKYPLAKNIFLKAGFQFNVNKYNIHAFSYVPEPAIIAIQSGGTSQSVTRTSYYRNFNGYSPNWLTNIYFSISVPVGMEVNFVHTKKLSVGLGLTGQPTYLLDNRAYLISTDFKNYTKVPDLIRRWNLNTGAELIFGFKAGKTKFQLGPQLRYQAYSSFKDKYPVKENLFNFGLKAGVSLNK